VLADDVHALLSDIGPVRAVVGANCRSYLGDPHQELPSDLLQATVIPDPAMSLRVVIHVLEPVAVLALESIIKRWQVSNRDSLNCSQISLGGAS
jgi:hypothetical protein